MGFFGYMGWLDDVLTILIVLMSCGGPVIVSIVVSIYSKHTLSHILSVVASILYGSWFAVYCIRLMHGQGNEVELMARGLFFLLVSSPFWMIARILNAHYAKRSVVSRQSNENE